jgi:hypothetical protein
MTRTFGVERGVSNTIIVREAGDVDVGDATLVQNATQLRRCRAVVVEKAAAEETIGDRGGEKARKVAWGNIQC